MILKQIKNIVFFDGNNINENCQIKNEYWLGSSEAEKYLKSKILFFDENGLEFAIKLFELSQNEFHKSLSDWQAPEKGFYKDDLLNLSKCFQFELRKNNRGNEEGVSLGYSLELIIKIEKNKTFFLIYAINGGRAPESVYFFGLYEVFIDYQFKNRYKM